MNTSIIQRNLVNKLCRYRSPVCFFQWNEIHFRHLLLHSTFCNTNNLRCSSVCKIFERSRHISAVVKRTLPTSNLSSTKCFCSKVVDVKYDPETKALLKEIVSDFENEKAQDIYKVQDGENSPDDSKYSEQVTESKDDSRRPEEEKSNIDFSLDETRNTSIPLKRGTHGVFELDELVTLLKEENGRDISVIEIPPEARFAEHMVVVSALSLRHLRSISSRVKWIHKQKKDSGDRHLRVEGFETAPDWHAMDLGNIILHVFMPDTREHYDLETLWTNWGQPGQEVVEDDPYEISPEDEFWANLEAQKENTEKEPK